jgi:hypothetical protein
MKAINYLKVALLVVPFLVAGCKTKKAVVEPTKPVSTETLKERDFLLQVNDNAQYAKFITSKVKFSVQVGVQKLSLTGNLKMKRDDCIRLQLMAFGFVEAGRIELTPDYVLIMDRINKQYMKATYSSIDFLRNSGLSFYSLQALFWNELFVPGQTKLTDATLLSKMNVDLAGEDAVLSLDDGKMQYRWLATKDKARIRMANITYVDQFRGNSQLNWDYEDFRTMESKVFPCDHNIMFSMPEKEVKLGMKLNYIKHDDSWETRTDVSANYREVTIDEILRRFMAL